MARVLANLLWALRGSLVTSLWLTLQGFLTDFVVSGPHIDDDDTDTIWRIGGVYQVNPYFAVEVDAGEAEVETTLIPPSLTVVDPAPYLQEAVTYQASGFEVSGLGQYPLTKTLHVLIRLGVIYL